MNQRAIFMSATQWCTGRGEDLKRDRITIWSEILSLALGGVGKTSIVRRINLTSKRAKRHIDKLVRMGLLEIIPGSSSKYRTTEEGIEFVKRYGKLKEFM
jgi:predicted transcriptional regulator